MCANFDATLKIFLTEAEKEKLDCDASKAGVSTSAYLRELLDAEPQPRPVYDWAGAVEKLKALGHGFNRIAHKGNLEAWINRQEYNEQIEPLWALLKELEGITLPQKEAVAE